MKTQSHMVNMMSQTEANSTRLLLGASGGGAVDLSINQFQNC